MKSAAQCQKDRISANPRREDGVLVPPLSASIIYLLENFPNQSHQLSAPTLSSVWLWRYRVLDQSVVRKVDSYSSVRYINHAAPTPIAAAAVCPKLTSFLPSFISQSEQRFLGHAEGDLSQSPHSQCSWVIYSTVDPARNQFLS